MKTSPEYRQKSVALADRVEDGLRGQPVGAHPGGHPPSIGEHVMNLQGLIPRLRELGWRVWPDSEPDFIPIGDDDLMPMAEAGSLALKQATRGWTIPAPPRRPWK